MLRCGHSVKDNSSIYNIVEGFSDRKTGQFYIGHKVFGGIYSMSDVEYTSILDTCNTNDTTFYIHTPLSCNLANNTIQVDKYMREVQHRLDLTNGLPAASVLHVGKKGTIEDVCTKANELTIHRGVGRIKSTLLFENSAGQGTELGHTWDEMRHLFEGLDNPTGKIGLCLDTQHMMAAGMCDFMDVNSISNMLDSAEDIISTGVNLIHFNDSKTDYFSRVDRHAPLGTGKIWSDSSRMKIRAVQYMLDRCQEDNIDLVCETCDHISDYKWIDNIRTKKLRKLNFRLVKK